MEWAIRLARQGLGRVSPNPPVGCVILNSSRELIGFGFHKIYGGPHAEIEALRSVEDKSELNGAAVFVTLEPCAHYGKTPPCALELTRYPIARVVVGARDPNPVAANGAKVLSDAGIEVEVYAPLETACEEVAEVFFVNQRLKRTFVHAKVATSLDGQMALATGESQWITNEKSRHFTQQLRGETDAVLIGYNTFAKDDPRLNSRHPNFSDKINKVVILDPDGRCLKTIQNSGVSRVRDLRSVIVVVSDATDVKSAPKDLELIKIPLRQGQFALDQLHKELFSRGVFSVLVEGGAATLSEFLKQKLIDRITIMMAPTIIGAREGLSWTKDFGVSNLEKQVRLHNPRVIQFDSDICITARIDSQPS